MKTTRQHDLDQLEERRARKSLERIHKKTKDPYLEKMRRDLIEAHKRKDFYLIDKLERLIVEYGRKHNL